ncbi:MAG: hypothetical protein HLX46_00345 [Corynebacterium sp.]|uniref:hypothetical protein n=1 Tax=Corynebacterium sp. TaxID=1720 RepID=UPI0018010EFA|nr:hypothetical protein [Corynebacterium sp.]NWO15307.1 hypothetical protein [Corynebacterium sp.]
MNPTINQFDSNAAQRINDGVEEVLLDIEGLAFVSCEDGKLFAIHDGSLANEHVFVAPVIDLARRAGLELVSDVSNSNRDYTSGNERVRWFA